MSNYKECLTKKEQFEYEYYLRVLDDIITHNLEDAKIGITHRFYTLFAEDAKKAGYNILSVSKSDLNGFYDVFLKKHPKETNNWEQVRIQAAIAAMQLIQTDETFKRWVQEAVEEGGVYYEEYPRIAVNIADAIVKELKGE